MTPPSSLAVPLCGDDLCRDSHARTNESEYCTCVYEVLGLSERIINLAHFLLAHTLLGFASKFFLLDNIKINKPCK